MKIIKLETERDGIHNITEEINKVLVDSNIQNGMVHVFVPHTTAGLCITSFWDPLGFQDIVNEIKRIVPTRIDFLHQYDTPQDAAGHIKSILVGVNESIIVEDGKLMLGSSQALYFVEFDGPRSRQFYVKVIEG